MNPNQRRRLARLFLVGGGLYAALRLWPSLPKETDVEFALGAAHQDVVELRVAYWSGTEALHDVTFSFPAGAPAQVHHKLTLPAGTVSVHCELRGSTGAAREVMHTLHTPVTGGVRLSLETPPSSAPAPVASHVREAT